MVRDARAAKHTNAGPTYANLSEGELCCCGGARVDGVCDCSDDTTPATTVAIVFASRLGDPDVAILAEVGMENTGTSTRTRVRPRQHCAMRDEDPETTGTAAIHARTSLSSSISSTALLNPRSLHGTWSKSQPQLVGFVKMRTDLVNRGRI